MYKYVHILFMYLYVFVSLLSFSTGGSRCSTRPSAEKSDLSPGELDRAGRLEVGQMWTKKAPVKREMERNSEVSKHYII